MKLIPKLCRYLTIWRDYQRERTREFKSLLKHREVNENKFIHIFVPIKKGILDPRKNI